MKLMIDIQDDAKEWELPDIINKGIPIEECDDCVSRQAAIDAIKKLHSIETEYDCTLYEKLDVLYELEDLPPVIPVEKQEPCENIGNIYKCSCGYGWDKNKVVRHHFCPNCGKAVDLSYNSIKTELKPCTDAISRQAVLNLAKFDGRDGLGSIIHAFDVEQLPPVTPAEKVGQWIKIDDCSNSGYYCSECHKRVVKEGWSDTVKIIKYCPNCGAKMEGEE